MERLEFICAEDGQRVDKVLADLLPDKTRSYLQKLIADGLVELQGKKVKKSTVVGQGNLLTIELPDPVALTAEAENIPLDIAYEDEYLLVVNKPKDMVVHPAAGNYTGTLVNALLGYCGDTLSGINGVLRPGIVHRIDKDTSGLLIVAKTDAAHQGLAAQIQAHSFTRQYEAVVVGHIPETVRTVNAPIARSTADRKKMAVISGGREAVTHIETIAEYPGYSHIRLTLETGRTHQIRVHMAHIGHPVVCDEVYGAKKPQFACCKGQCLHARRIAFEHPVTGEHIDLVSDLPDYFKSVLREIDKG
ncbi:MAG: RluA family pseudouridine synthase [Ruminococcaceae bacterium]|nr:RluA family pseudouridine synthase [Oscillospiraceae bacterium]